MRGRRKWARAGGSLEHAWCERAAGVSVRGAGAKCDPIAARAQGAGHVVQKGDSDTAPGLNTETHAATGLHAAYCRDVGFRPIGAACGK